MDLPTGIVTFLFTDIEGSTNLARTLGSRWPHVLEEHNAILRNAIRAHDGIDIRTEGDAFFAVFRSPGDAVRAAATAQRVLADREWPADGPIRVRMGMHTGEGRLAGDDYVGLDVHRAARIAAAGHGGQVLLSDAARVLVGDGLTDGLTLRDLGQHRLKDFDDPQHIYQLEIEGLEREFPPLKTRDMPTRLPVQLTSFIGRKREVHQVSELLERSRLVTLTGPGGTGKTRLAIEAATRITERFPDGVYFVDLSPTRDPALVPSAMVTALGLKQLPDRGALESVTEYLRNRVALLILDNFEQVTEASGVARVVLEESPSTNLLVTSRVHLDLPGEHEFPVPPLDVPELNGDVGAISQNEAVELFVHRARAVRPSFEISDQNARSIAEVCARLDGLPLAIELAAAQTRLLSPSELLQRLQQRLSGLSTGSRNVPERQRTLRSTIEWSYELLEPADRRLFARLGVFAGGGTFESIEAVCNPATDLGVETLEGLASLIGKSLLRRMEFPEGSRFTMLETIRDYARERLEAEFDLDDTERRHAGYFATLAEERGPTVRGATADIVEAVVRDIDNFRAALSWSLRMDQAQFGLRIAAALWRVFVETGHLREAVESLESLLALPSAKARDRIRASGVMALGSLLYWQTDYRGTQDRYEEALSIFEEVGDETERMQALMYLAYSFVAQEDPDNALRTIEKALALSEFVTDEALLAELTGLRGGTHITRGEYDEGLRWLEESLERFEAAGALLWSNETRARISSLYRMQGRVDEAEAYLRQSFEVYQMVGGLTNSGAVALQFAAVATARGDHERAMRLAGFAEKVSEQLGGRPPTALLLIPDFRAEAATTLDEATIDRLWNEGKSMDLEEAAHYMLREKQE
ncbi:MAG TPA: tetratricopeptide repeat protein [Actinomycetota bacterium]|nr:tetratricopeptide repeat protein [Actinomycetota bacterium]